jgi:pyruvate-ferredoxin/flavodoxin oxidoreductase
LVCPHAAIRPFLINEEEMENAPEGFETSSANGKKLKGHVYRIQVSSLDCAGCGVCANVCPAPNKALTMEPFAEQVEKEKDNWNYAVEEVGYKEDLMNENSVKGSQFQQPLLEFSGACAGCGETAYAKLVTQLFGDRMLIANATGCSSIWGGSAPASVYTTNEDGHGPAWANSLFEDNAEYGYGMYLGMEQTRSKLADLMKEAIEEDKIGDDLKEIFTEWLEVKDRGEESKAATIRMVPLLNKYKDNEIVAEILDYKEFLTKKSQWIFGGDGWAYDIGYGGLDHVLASGDDVNVFVFDTEVYSNTGGQSSKATPTAAAAKFAASGKRVKKKDLGRMAMTYGYVYVAQIALGSDMNQAVKAIKEAEEYDGPSLIIAYAPCIAHGLKEGMGCSVDQEGKAVESGYWHLYRYNPELKGEKNPFSLDSKEPTGSFRDFLLSEVRFSSLKKTFPEVADDLFARSEEDANERYEAYKRLEASFEPDEE